MRTTLAALFVVVLAMPLSLAAQSRSNRAYPPEIKGAQVEIYKTVGDVTLKMFIFTPQGHKAGDNRPAAVFFFGGGWKAGTPQQFEQHCKYLASRGMVAMTADYRVRSRHGTLAKSCVADAKSAVRWVRTNSKRLGIDPDRIVAGGGSAGGHLAACTGTIQQFDESTEDASISSRPNAMALFNPALVLAPLGDKLPLNPEVLKTLPERMGVAPEALSPAHHVKKEVPPTIIFHGTGDETVLFHSAKQFTDAMKKAGNRCELVAYEGQPHGFFNYGRSDNKYFQATLFELDKFLASLGYLKGKPTIDQWIK